MANKAIRGITVEIGGNTTKLDKALGSTEKKSRSLQVELREITKLLKFDPTNTELLAQKQDVLTSAIAETTQKLKTLKEAEAQVIAQFERGDIGEDQLRAFQREIMQTEKSLDDMRSELSATETAIKNLADGTDSAEKHTDEYRESVEKAKNELSEFKEKASETFDTLKTGATILGGTMVAAGGYALKLSTDFDKAFNTLVTRTGASADEMEELNEAMERVYANNFGESIEDVAESMATVKQNTKLTGEALQEATEYALLMRDTFDFEVGESTRSAKMLMDQFGVSAEEAYNLIAQGAQSGLDKNGDLLDTINEYSVHFKQLGFDAPEMFNMLANGAENGTFSVDKLGDAIKEFGIRVKDGSESSAAAFEYLGYDADALFKTFNEGGQAAADMTQILIDELASMPDSVEKTTAGVALFGTMWEDLGAEGIKALSELDGGISTTKNALEEINNTKYDDIGSALQGLGRTLETDVVKPLGEELKPVVEEAIDYVKENGPQIKDILVGVVDKIGEFVSFVVNNGDAIVSTVVAIGTGLLVWNVASMISSVVGAIKAYKLANEGATIAQALFNAVLNANPLMLIATLVAALVAGIVTFIMTNDEAREKFVEIWNKIKNTAKNVLDSIVKFFKDSWTAIQNAWKSCVGFFSGIWSKIKQAYSDVKSWFSNMFKSAWDAIKNTWNAVGGFFSDVWSKVKNVFSNAKSWFSTTFNDAWNAVKNAFSGWGNFFSGLWTQIKNKFSDIGSNIGSAISSSIKTGINGVLSTVENTINSGIRLINRAITLANKIPGVNVGTIGEISLPRLAKGGIVDRPTIAEIGEDGREAVIPLERNTGWLNQLAKELNGYLRPPQPVQADGALLTKLDRIYDRLDRLQIVLDTGTLVGETIDKIDARLATRQLLSVRGV